MEELEGEVEKIYLLYIEGEAWVGHAGTKARTHNFRIGERGQVEKNIIRPLFSLNSLMFSVELSRTKCL